jgi:hypothetical protein
VIVEYSATELSVQFTSVMPAKAGIQAFFLLSDLMSEVSVQTGRRPAAALDSNMHGQDKANNKNGRHNQILPVHFMSPFLFIPIRDVHTRSAHEIKCVTLHPFRFFNFSVLLRDHDSCPFMLSESPPSPSVLAVRLNHVEKCLVVKRLEKIGDSSKLQGQPFHPGTVVAGYEDGGNRGV